MAKTQEELSTLKQEYETLTNELEELNEEELKFVSGGFNQSIIEIDPGTSYFDINE